MSKLCRKHPVMWTIDSISVKIQVCLITQEAKIQKSGHQQPVHVVQPCYVTGHRPISQGLVFRWTSSPFTSFTAGSALVIALPHLLIAFHCLFSAHTSFSFWKVRFHKMWKPSYIWVNLLWGTLAPGWERWFIY